MRRILVFLLAVMVAGVVAANPFVSPSEPHGILDFAGHPNTLESARLVVFDGTNVNAPITRTSFWVAPGEHTMVIAAAIAGADMVGFTPRRNRSDGSQEVTIQVEEGKRYRIAARLLDRQGNWEPVVWKIEGEKD
jgi:hypothetical protein